MRTIYVLQVLLINFIIQNKIHSSSITLNLAYKQVAETINNKVISNKQENNNKILNNVQQNISLENAINKYKHSITYSNCNGVSKNLFFKDFNANKSISKSLNVNNKGQDFFYKILKITNNNFAITTIKSYPISTNGNCILDNGVTYNLYDNFGLPNNASSVLILLDNVFISANVKQISIINKNHLKPVVFINYNSEYLNNINCFRIPYLKLNNTKNESNTCSLNRINANRYTILNSNKKFIMINGKYYSKQPLVIKGTNVEHYKLCK